MPIGLLSSALRDALHNDQPDQIEPNLTKRPKATRYGELDTCLLSAMPSGSLKMIATLLRLEARLCSQSLWRAMERQDIEVFHLLLESGWDINSHDFELTAIHCAVWYETSLRWLLDHGANPNVRSRHNPGTSVTSPRTPLALAAEHISPFAVNILMAHGAHMDPDALFYAISVRGEPTIATFTALLDHGADVNHHNQWWYTPLYHAIWRNQVEKIKLLIERGADPDLKSGKRGMSAMDWASNMENREDREEVMRILEEGRRWGRGGRLRARVETK